MLFFTSLCVTNWQRPWFVWECAQLPCHQFLNNVFLAKQLSLEYKHESFNYLWSINNASHLSKSFIYTVIQSIQACVQYIDTTLLYLHKEMWRHIVRDFRFQISRNMDQVSGGSYKYFYTITTSFLFIFCPVPSDL